MKLRLLKVAASNGNKTKSRRKLHRFEPLKSPFSFCRLWKWGMFCNLQTSSVKNGLHSGAAAAGCEGMHLSWYLPPGCSPQCPWTRTPHVFGVSGETIGVQAGWFKLNLISKNKSRKFTPFMGELLKFITRVVWGRPKPVNERFFFPVIMVVLGFGVLGLKKLEIPAKGKKRGKINTRRRQGRKENAKQTSICLKKNGVNIWVFVRKTCVCARLPSNCWVSVLV